MLRTLLTAFLALAFALPAPAQDDYILKSGDRKKLAKAVSAWVDAEVAQDSEDRLTAMDAIQKNLSNLKKKLKDVNIFSALADWSNALSSERDYPKQKVGKLVMVPLPGGSEYGLWVPKAYKPKKASMPAVMVLGDGGATGDAVLAQFSPTFLESTLVLIPDFQGVAADDLLTSVRQRILFTMVLGTHRLRIDRSKLSLLAFGSSTKVASSFAALAPHFFSGVSLVGGPKADDLPVPNLALFPMEEHADTEAAVAWIQALPARRLAITEFEFEIPYQEFPAGYWVLATKFDPKDSTPDGEVARVKISIDRDSNTVRIDAKHVYQVELLLNDALVDLSKEVTFIRNGEPLKMTFQRGLGNLFEGFRRFLFDESAVFPVRVRSIDIPVGK